MKNIAKLLLHNCESDTSKESDDDGEPEEFKSNLKSNITSKAIIPRMTDPILSVTDMQLKKLEMFKVNR